MTRVEIHQLHDAMRRCQTGERLGRASLVSLEMLLRATIKDFSELREREVAMEQLRGVLRDRLAEIDSAARAMAGRTGELARTEHRPVDYQELGAWSDKIGRAADAIRRAAGLDATRKAGSNG